MGLLDKLKDLFIDEIETDEDMELEEENKKIYEEPKDILPKVMRDTIKEDEGKKESQKVDLKLDRSKSEEPKTEKVTEPTNAPSSKFTFPIDFEADYLPKRSNNVNVLNLREEKIDKAKEPPKEKITPKTSTLYPKKEIPKEKPKFKVSPVISPVYGILDKNYKKEEVTVKEETAVSMKRPSKTVDFETVRKKAFGNLTDDLKDSLMCENCELYKEVKRISNLKEDDLLYDMTVDEQTPVTIEKAYDNYKEFGVAYEPDTTTNTHKDEIIVNHNDEEPQAEFIEIKETPKEEVKVQETLPSREEKHREIKNEVLESAKEEAKEKVDADFFELIDSMYKERSEE